MHTIFFALGSNVGNKEKNIEQAISLLGEKINNITKAQLYTTKPMYFEDQDQFVNTALSGKTSLTLAEALRFVKDIEKKIGRQTRFRNGPREIDIDILFYDSEVYKDETLEVPHPRIAERDFVLRPLVDIAPDFLHPVLKKTVRELLAQLPKETLTVIPKISSKYIYILKPPIEFEKYKKDGFYAPPSLMEEGFLHASTQEQIIPTANRVFKKEKELIILKINTDKVGAEIKLEFSKGSKQYYPHIYGKLPLSAIESSRIIKAGRQGFIL